MRVRLTLIILAMAVTEKAVRLEERWIVKRSTSLMIFLPTLFNSLPFANSIKTKDRLDPSLTAVQLETGITGLINN